MAKVKGNQNMFLWIAGIVALVYFMGGQGGDGTTTTTTTSSDGGIDIGALVKPTVSFTGQDMFLAGTTRANDWVRVLERNGNVRDLGLVSMNSGTIAVTPGQNYKFYYAENASASERYTAVESFMGPAIDAPTNKLGRVCTIDATPTLTAFDEFGTPGSDTTMAASEEKTVVVRVQASADQCYGNPDAPTDNAICFKFSTGNWTSVKGEGAAINAPFNIASNITSAGTDVSCYKLPKLSDNGFVDHTVTLTAHGVNNPAGNVSVWVNDISFDLDADTLEEIWGFEDEDNNELGSKELLAGYIKIK